MTMNLVIDNPDWQSPRQRVSSLLLLACGWTLWLYFAFPFVELCGWWLDVRVCSWWVNLSGGYLGLRILLFLYGKTLAGLLGGWCAWSLYNTRRERQNRAPGLVPVTPGQLQRDFGLDEQQLVAGRTSRHITVHFDASGRIIDLATR